MFRFIFRTVCRYFFSSTSSSSSSESFIRGLQCHCKTNKKELLLHLHKCSDKNVCKTCFSTRCTAVAPLHRPGRHLGRQSGRLAARQLRLQHGSDEVVWNSRLHLGKTDYIIARQHPKLSLCTLADDQSPWSKCSMCFFVSAASLQPPQSPLLEYDKLLYNVLHMLEH